MSFNHKPTRLDNSMDEYDAKFAADQEYELARDCGMDEFEASHYTPAQMRATSME